MRTDEISIESESSPLAFVGEATPYSYIGDSHANIGTLVFEDEAKALRVATRTYFLWAFGARDFLAKGATLGDPLVETLRRCGALHSSPTFPPLPGLRPVTTFRDGMLYEEGLKVTALSSSQPYVLCAGELNVRYLLGRFADEEIDFDTPFVTDGLNALPTYHVRATVPFAKLLPIVLDEIGDIFQGLRILREAGLTTLFLHCLPPPTLDDRAFAKIMGFQAPARLRYKLTMLVNFLYERAAREIGIGFINTWASVTDGNLRRAEFELDAIHLNRKHAILSVQEVHRQFSALKPLPDPGR